MRRFLVIGSIGCLFLVVALPADARWGAFRISATIRSGDQVSGPAYDGEWVPSLTRHVRPGHGVAFWVDAFGHGMPVPDPVVRGCASGSGVDVRYLLETDAGDRDITDDVTTSGWSPRRADSTSWDVTVRIAVRVGERAVPGTTFPCRVSVNGDAVRALVDVA